MTKKTFADNLGEILFTDVMDNSYYNDECDVECYTPDYNEAYRFLMDTGPITEDELKSTFANLHDEDSKEVEFSGLDLIKMTISGDFDNDYNTGSSEALNLQCIHSLLGSLEDKTWTEYQKQKLPKELWKVGANDYKKKKLRSTPLSSIAYNRIYHCTRTQSADQLKLCRKIAQKLKDFKGFNQENNPLKHGGLVPSDGPKPSEKSYLEKLKEELKTEREQKDFIKDVQKMATYAKNERFNKICEGYNTRHFAIRDAAAQYMVFGTSNDTLFDNIAKDIQSVKDKVKESIKQEESVTL